MEKFHQLYNPRDRAITTLMKWLREGERYAIQWTFNGLNDHWFVMTPIGPYLYYIHQANGDTSWDSLCYSVIEEPTETPPYWSGYAIDGDAVYADYLPFTDIKSSIRKYWFPPWRFYSWSANPLGFIYTSLVGAGKYPGNGGWYLTDFKPLSSLVDHINTYLNKNIEDIRIPINEIEIIEEPLFVALEGWSLQFQSKLIYNLPPYLRINNAFTNLLHSKVQKKFGTGQFTASHYEYNSSGKPIWKTFTDIQNCIVCDYVNVALTSVPSAVGMAPYVGSELSNASLASVEKIIIPKITAYGEDKGYIWAEDMPSGKYLFNDTGYLTNTSDFGRPLTDFEWNFVGIVPPNHKARVLSTKKSLLDWVTKKGFNAEEVSEHFKKNKDWVSIPDE